MFSTTGLFKSVPCPRREKCDALNCIFSHDARILGLSVPQSSHDAAKHSGKPISDSAHPSGPPVKKRKLDVTLSTTSSTHESRPTAVQPRMTIGPKSKVNSPATPQTLKKTITPPVPAAQSKKPDALPAKQEVLNPRLLISAPAGHEKRTLYLKYLHDQMMRLNKLVNDGKHSEKVKLVLDSQELITAALDEERQLAFDNPTVYSNVIKQRIGTYKKMAVDDWISHVKDKIFAAHVTTNGKTPDAKPIVTTLTTPQEVRLLSELSTSKDMLTKLGFVLEPPTLEAIEERKVMTMQANHFEVCDRCKSRFQVFPERRESDGVLTTNGPCIYHWGKMRYPKREKTDKIKGSKDPVYICCGELLNAPGCTTCDSHVFKMVEAARMGGVVQFTNTPANTNPKKDHKDRPVKAVTFDCEMGYTVYGLELIRLTAVTWPDNDELIDILVRPKGTILDFNTRFSGVDTSTFTSAVPWTEGLTPLPTESGTNGKTVLPIVPDPETARAIFCSYITPDTPLIGHALENDMNSIRLCHPVIVDTIALFPHPKGLPIRYGLKQLTLTHLGRDIQTGGEAGHDSLEDARATGDLVRVKVGQTWEQMKKKGWVWKGGELVAPESQRSLAK
ncbi:hypothetical protein KVT40_004073 [Elsinoe batatas]|uniref:Exonuclease domain-containing protein n=1 Tax=Elsinoe batatas TaxID=2601811 RepID=A0A8K0PDL9_9PEZI|nr:hypothetical protein KVT40_004073 [Elsinoe batatas]